MLALPRLERAFQRIIALRVPILIAYALLVPAAAFLASRVPSEGAIDRLVVPTDPDFVATREFQRIFPERQTVVLLVESADPWRPEVLERVRQLERALRAIPRVSPVSILDVYGQARAGAPASAGEVRRFANGTPFFRRQGLVGDRFLGVVVALDVAGAAERDATLAAVDAAAARAEGGAVGAVRKVGGPYVESWIERASREASGRYFPVFGAFVVAITLFLYRSARALVAILAALAASVALGTGVGALLGFSFTVVSALVPLTVMVTTLANLVYLHSRYVDQPEAVPLELHHPRALANKFLPVTVSSGAAALGFAALTVSGIRPIREMGIWTAAGLALAWVVAFTLFPALQRALRTPTRRAVEIRTALYDRAAAALPAFTWRFRLPLVAGALLLSAGGLLALLGFPGRLAPMQVGLDILSYVDPAAPVHRDMVFFRTHVAGLNVARLWVATPPGQATDPEVLRGLDRLTAEVERIPGVSSVVGPTTFLRLRRYAAGEPETLPADRAAFAAAAGDVEQLLLSQPELRAFIDVATLSNAQLTVVFQRGDGPGIAALTGAVRAAWQRAAAEVPALRRAELRIDSPTIRSSAARLLAMIPSVFAILATFLAMRLAGASLNVATILIATTVLGTTENDQIHFFHHLHEGEGPAGLDGALRHTLRIAGRAVLFATIINAAGFLALSLSTFPPLRQFGVITAGAFLLAMIADFTALPAALWMARREAPRGP